MPNLRALLVIALSTVAVACADLTSPKASLATFSDVVTVFPLNGAPAGAPNAINLSAASGVRADPSLGFDLAIDRDSSGNIRLLPIRLVANQLASTHTVSLQTSVTPYDSLTRAPKTGYVADSALVVSRGQTAVIAVTNPVYCYGSLVSSTFYAKMVVDSIDAAGAFHTRITTDPNCGFYALTLGVPKD